mgnify:CR=1 FL=1
MMISFAVLCGIVLEGVVFLIIDKEPLSSFSLNWFQLLSIPLTGAVCSLVTVLLLCRENLSKKAYMISVIIHCICLYGVVILFGKLFSWYTKMDGFILMTIIYFLVYAFVWIATLFLQKQDDNRINKALDSIRDEE